MINDIKILHSSSTIIVNILISQQYIIKIIKIYQFSKRFLIIINYLPFTDKMSNKTTDERVRDKI